MLALTITGMPGLDSVFPHLITIGLLLIASLVISFVAKINIIGARERHGDGEEGKKSFLDHKQKIQKTFKTINVGLFSAAIVCFPSGIKIDHRASGGGFGCNACEP